MSTRRVSRTPTRPPAQAAPQHIPNPSANWKLTAPEVESASTLYIESEGGKNFNKACEQLWARTEHAPDTLHYMAIPRGRPDQIVLQKKQNLTQSRLEELVTRNLGASIQVIWLEETQKRDQQPPSRRAETVATVKYLAEALGVSPLFLDYLFILRSTLPFSKLSDWPNYQDDNRFSARTTDLSGMYRNINDHSVWFRHSFKEGQHSSSIYIVHNIRQWSSSAQKFFARVEALRSGRATRSSLLKFMTIDILFSDMAKAHSDLNDCYKNLKTALDSIDEHAGKDFDGVQERTKKLYGTLKDSYKGLNVLNTRGDDQFQTIDILRSLLKAYSLLDWDAQHLAEREQRVISMHCALDGMKMEMNVMMADIGIRSQFFGQLMNLHLGALMQIDSSTSLSIAKSSEKIATETKKDGRSMMMIAIVTMVFLPASLVAAILDTPFFSTGDEVPGKLKVSPSFWILWVVSLPLTVLVFATWLTMPRIGRAIERASNPTEKEM